MYKVTLKARGKQFEYNSAPDQSPLEAARNEFIPFPVGCRRGGCGMCKVKVLNGDYEQELVRSQEALSDEELENNFALGCCMTAKSDLDLITIEDYESSNVIVEFESRETRMMDQNDSSRKETRMVDQKNSLTESLVLRILEAITNKSEELQSTINVAVVNEGEKFSINITIN